MVVAFLLFALGTLVLVAAVQHARTQEWRAIGLRSLRPRRRSRPLPAPPADDLPPVGLAPLIPSPRVIANECERGLRELSLFLAVQNRD